jgi:iron complex transport system permease protein
LKPTHHKILFLGLLTILAFVLNVSIGSTEISMSQLWQGFWGDGPNSLILWQFRLPKAVTCVLAGSSLAAAGLLMQVLFRNPLAGPDVLGLSSGASLLVALTLLATPLAASIFGTSWGIALAASIGSGLVFIMMLLLARRIADSVSLLIVGLMMAATTSSLVGILQYLSAADDLQAFIIWTMGTVGATNWTEISVLSVAVGIGLVLAFAQIKSLNAFLLGEAYASSLGIRVRRARLGVVLATSLMVGAVTSFCGPIAFVGLAVPHLVRLALPTSNHKHLLPAVVLGGALLLLVCDLLAQLPGSTQLLPLNAVTSLIGAPIVIWMVLQNHKRLLILDK